MMDDIKVTIKVNYDEKTGKVVAFNRNTLPYIEITEEERRQPLPDKYSYYAVEDGKFLVKRREPTEEEAARDKEAARQERLHEISNWLCENDWKVNKVFLGEWETTDPRWTEYLETRAQMRAEHDELTKEV
jgi:hypothetical protein